MAIQPSANVSELSFKREGSKSPIQGISTEELQRSIHLAGLLQTSLEVDAVLENFLTAARQLVSFSGVLYQNDEHDLHYEFGKQGPHSCSYNLRLGNDHLGELTFAQKRRFQENDTKQLEGLLCYLVYPLKNALLYKGALEAAQIDNLTGAYNRSAFDSALAREIELAQRHCTSLTMLVLDIDHFKSINDSKGHKAGDEVLSSVAQSIKGQIRSCDVLYRYGGEEFVVLLSNTEARGAHQVAERIRLAIKNRPVNYNGRTISTTISIGVAQLGHDEGPLSFFERADAALYDAKNSGRNQTCIAPTDTK